MSKASFNATVTKVIGAVVVPVSLWFLVTTPSTRLFSGFFLFIGLYILWDGFASSGRLEKDFNWYKASHPKAIDAKGNVTCHSCGSKKIHTRNMLNKTYTREHFCGNCGTSLFFSPEG